MLFLGNRLVGVSGCRGDYSGCCRCRACLSLAAKSHLYAGGSSKDKEAFQKVAFIFGVRSQGLNVERRRRRNVERKRRRGRREGGEEEEEKGCVINYVRRHAP